MSLKAIRRQRGRPQADAEWSLSREEILDVALRAFADEGYEGVSVRQICRSLGVSHGLLNLRFGSKEELWSACVDHAFARIRQELRSVVPTGSVTERFRAMAIASLRGIALAPALLQLVNHEGARDSDRLDYLVEMVLEERYDQLQNIIDEGVAEGIFVEVSQNLVSVMLAHGGGVIFALQPLAKKWGLVRGQSDLELTERANEIADILLRGLRKTPPGRDDLVM
jgi:TetR/AcrR family transcriptional regulator